MTPHNIDEMAYVADKMNPPKTGERFISLWDFEMALQKRRPLRAA